MQTVYFDYNATTPLDPQVREAMLPFLGEIWGNPSSVHHVGRQARAPLGRSARPRGQVPGRQTQRSHFHQRRHGKVNLAIFGTARC